MRVNNIYQSHIQFKAITLSSKEYKKINSLIKDYATKSVEQDIVLAKDKIFLFVDKYLKMFAEEKCNGFRDSKTVLQRIYLLFFEALEEYKSSSNPIGQIIETMNGFKTNADDVKSNYLSLGKVPAKSYTKKYEVVVSNDRAIQPPSISYHKQKKASKKVQKIIELPELSQIDTLILKKRAEGMIYKDIGKDLGISKVAAREKVLNAITKIQDAKELSVVNFDEITHGLISRLGINKSFDKVKKLVIKNLCLREKSIDFLDENSTNISKALKIEKEVFTTSAIEHPQVMLMKPDTILNNINTASKLLGVSSKRYIEACLKQPQLMYLNPATIKDKVQKSSHLMGVNEKDFIETALKNPTMFYQKPETLARKTKIVDYYKKLQKMPSDKLKSINLKSDEKLFSNCLKYLIAQKTGAKFDYTYTEKDLIEYLKNNSSEKIEIELIPDSVTEDLISYAINLSENICGKNIFKFVV